MNGKRGCPSCESSTTGYCLVHYNEQSLAQFVHEDTHPKADITRERHTNMMGRCAYCIRPFGNSWEAVPWPCDTANVLAELDKANALSETITIERNTLVEALAKISESAYLAIAALKGDDDD